MYQPKPILVNLGTELHFITHVLAVLGLENGDYLRP